MPLEQSKRETSIVNKVRRLISPVVKKFEVNCILNILFNYNRGG